MDMWLIIEIIVWIIFGGIIGWLANKLGGVGWSSTYASQR